MTIGYDDNRFYAILGVDTESYNWRNVIDIERMMRKLFHCLRYDLGEDLKTRFFHSSQLSGNPGCLKMLFSLRRYDASEENDSFSIINSISFDLYLGARLGVYVDFDQLTNPNDDYTNLDNVVFISNEELLVDGPDTIGSRYDGPFSQINDVAIAQLISKIIISKL